MMIEKVKKKTSQEMAEEFVYTWQTSRSAKEVAEKLGKRYASVKSKASWYRRAGIPLKYFHGKEGSKPFRHLNYVKLIEMAKFLEKDEEAA